jgi:hypothetical protein
MVEGCNCIEGCNCRNSASSPTVMMSPCSGCLTSSFVAKISGFLLSDFAARILEDTASPVHGMTKLRLTKLRLSISSNQLIILSVFHQLALCPVALSIDSSPNAAKPALVSGVQS